MTSQAHFVQPPRFATWLVNLFTLPEEESIVWDLFEEFCQLASKSGRWVCAEMVLAAQFENRHASLLYRIP
jgi:hypothetical protein